MTVALVERLNIGSGPMTPEGWLHIDHTYMPGVTNRSRTDLLEHGTAPLSDGSPWVACIDVRRGIPLAHRWCDGAVAHHFLQMIDWPDLVPVLSTIRNMLNDGAWLRLSVPDFPAAYVAALDGDRDWFPIADEIESSIDGKLVCYLTQCGATRSLFTGPWLEDLLRRAGFVGVHTTSFGQTAGPEWLVELDSRPRESLFVEGRA